MGDLFTKEDEEDLLHSRSIRKQLLDKYMELTDGGVPKEKDEAAIVLQLLNGLDNNVVKTVGARSKAKEVDNDNTFANSVLSILRERAQSKANAVGEYPNTGMLSDDLPVLPGETDIGIQDLRLDDIIDEE